jgi:hypothetical protein
VQRREEIHGKMRICLNSGQTNAVKPTVLFGVAAGMVSGPGGDYRGRTRGEHQENTKGIPREYQENTIATR